MDAGPVSIHLLNYLDRAVQVRSYRGNSPCGAQSRGHPVHGYVDMIERKLLRHWTSAGEAPAVVMESPVKIS